MVYTEDKQIHNNILSYLNFRLNLKLHNNNTLYIKAVTTQIRILKICFMPMCNLEVS